MKTAFFISFQSPPPLPPHRSDRERDPRITPPPFFLSSFPPFPFWAKVRDQRLRAVGKAGL